MKKTTCYLMICCILLSFTSCMIYQKYRLTEENTTRSDLWLSRTPFAFFSYDSNFFEGVYKKTKKVVPFCYHHNGGVFAVCFSDSKFGESDIFKGYVIYGENYIYHEIHEDYIGFFDKDDPKIQLDEDEEYPFIRFDKTTKYAFLKEYGNLKYQRELPELKSASYGKTESKFLGTF